MNKDLNLNQIFLFDELPSVVQNDFLIQIENDLRIDQNDFVFCLRKILYAELLEKFDSILGPNLIDEIEDDRIIELAEDIEKNGMHYPPIGREGVHRSLAHIHLRKDMFYYEISFLSEADNLL